jgi:hypothetical protein
MTITHEDIWTAIDTLAARHGLTTSGLARRAGLDPTTFNRSKRTTVGGHRRWPTTESLAKVMAATGTSVRELVGLLGVAERKGADRTLPPRRMPVEVAGLFDGESARSALRAGLVPGVPTLVFRVPEEGLAPGYRAGDRLLLDLADALSPGSRALVVTTDGTVTAGDVVAIEPRGTLAIRGQGRETPARGCDVALAARIIWASQ